MTLIDSILEKLGTAEPWIEKGGVHWLTASALNVRDLAKTMNALQARFVTITAYQLPGTEGMRLEYHWDLDGQLLGFTFLLATTCARPWTGLSARFTKASPLTFWDASTNRFFCAMETSRA